MAVMSKRVLKQLAYGGFYLIVLLGLGGIVYVTNFKAAPSCFDRKQNGGELDVDCDGPCAKVCTPSSIRLPKVINFPQVITLRDSSGASLGVTVLARIENANADYAVRTLPYAVTIFDSGGTSRVTKSGDLTIYAGEIVHLLVPNIEPTGKGPFTATVSFGEPVWARAGSFLKPEVGLRDTRTVNENRFTVARGIAVNQGVLVIPALTVTALFYDSSGVLAGASKTVLQDIEPQEARPFSVFYPLIENIDIRKTEVLLHPERTP